MGRPHVALDPHPSLVHPLARYARSGTDDAIQLLQALDIQTLEIFVSLFFIPLAGWLSDRVGRKPLIVSYSVAGVVLAYLLFLVFSGEWGLGDVAAQVVFAIIVGFAYGVWPVAIVELYPARVRSSALALSFNVVGRLRGGHDAADRHLPGKRDGSGRRPVDS